VIIEWNPVAESIYGWARRDALGRNIIDVTPTSLSRERAAEIMQTLGFGHVWSGEFPLQTRTGGSFVASVTDVPIMNGGVVTGVIGVSAPSSGPALLRESLIRFGAGCEAIWPARVSMTINHDEASVKASVPHMLQLLSLIALRYTDALDAGAILEILTEPARESLLSGFGIPPGPLAHIQIGTARDRKSASLLRDDISSAQPDNFAAALTRILGGWIFTQRDTSTHLLVPVQC
jgi:PAS domain-containing protein